MKERQELRLHTSVGFNKPLLSGGICNLHSGGICNLALPTPPFGIAVGDFEFLFTLEKGQWMQHRGIAYLLKGLENLK